MLVSILAINFLLSVILIVILVLLVGNSLFMEVTSAFTVVISVFMVVIRNFWCLSCLSKTFGNKTDILSLFQFNNWQPMRSVRLNKMI